MGQIIGWSVLTRTAYKYYFVRSELKVKSVIASEAIVLSAKAKLIAEQAQIKKLRFEGIINFKTINIEL